MRWTLPGGLAVLFSSGRRSNGIAGVAAAALECSAVVALPVGDQLLGASWSCGMKTPVPPGERSSGGTMAQAADAVKGTRIYPPRLPEA